MHNRLNKISTSVVMVLKITRLFTSLRFCAFALFAFFCPGLFAGVLFDQLDKVPSGQEVTIRGFLYRTPEGRWIVAKDPHLRTCCLGSPLNKESQISFSGDFDPALVNRAVTVIGIWKAETDGYRLLEARLIQEPGSPWQLFGLLAAVFALLTTSVLIWKRRSAFK